MSVLLIVIIILAIGFDFINGFHDAANSIATIVSTKVLTPFQAVIWAAFFNFLAFFIFRDHGVANTVAKTVNEGSYDLIVVLSGIIAAIIWNLLTWWYGIPSSSSHTLIGGFAGAAVAHAGFAAINWSLNGGISLTLLFILIAPDCWYGYFDIYYVGYGSKKLLVKNIYHYSRSCILPDFY